jgi:tellurite resistance protein
MLENVERAPASSWLDGALARFAADNADLSSRTRTLLDAIVAAPQRHARLLNTLSLLEHMGSHKIMATQHSAAVDQATLKHLAEEAQHAFFMKRQAEKTAERALEYVAQDLLAPASARMYFQRLEGATVRALGEQRSSRAAYLYMSMIVEFRALWFYGLYEQALKRARHALSLKRVLGEEQAHLGDMAERLDAGGELDDARAAQVLAAERRLYSRLLGALERVPA